MGFLSSIIYYAVLIVIVILVVSYFKKNYVRKNKSGNNDIDTYPRPVSSSGKNYESLIKQIKDEDLKK